MKIVGILWLENGVLVERAIAFLPFLEKFANKYLLFYLKLFRIHIYQINLWLLLELIEGKMC